MCYEGAVTRTVKSSNVGKSLEFENLIGSINITINYYMVYACSSN